MDKPQEQQTCWQEYETWEGERKNIKGKKKTPWMLPWPWNNCSGGYEAGMNNPLGMHMKHIKHKSSGIPHVAMTCICCSRGGKQNRETNNPAQEEAEY